MKNIFNKLWTKILIILGDIRISNFFPWLYYDTTVFQVKGANIQDIHELLIPGDIIIRGYSNYLDSKFIPGTCIDKNINMETGGWSHGAIYIGDNTIIHAVAEGVSKISVIDFCQCDRIAIFRPKKGQKKAIKTAKHYEEIDTPYDFFFQNGNNAIYCFELCALCYPNLDLKTVTVKKLLFLKKNVYLAQSFFNSKDFKCVYQYNPKFNIDYKKEI